MFSEFFFRVFRVGSWFNFSGMIQYPDLLRHVMEHGKFKSDRTGTGTYSLFGAQARYPLADGFPLLTTRRFTPSPSSMSCSGFCGETNIKYLKDNGVSIWDTMGRRERRSRRVCGAQWCDWRTADGRSINQIDDVIAQIKKNPGQPPPHRQRVESRANKAWPCRPVPSLFPVLRQ